MNGTRRAAIVTGAARGIGRAIAERLAADGFGVVVADILGDQAEAAAAEIGGATVAVRVDVSDAESAREMVAQCREEFGRIDALVNNAALIAGLPRRPFEEIPEKEWDRVMAVNVKGVWQVSRAVAPVMRRQGSGSIVNISSDTVLSGVPGLLHYVASKGALVALTRSLASEMGSYGVRVNAVAPGFTTTEAALEHGGDALARSVERRALKRVQGPEDLVGTISWLVSDDAAFVTGQLVVVNGGYVYH